MLTFFTWIFIIALILVAYSVFLWYRLQKQFRFQARLTVWFLVIVLVSTVPLILFVSMTLNQTTEMLRLPALRQALEHSVQLVRNQLDTHCDYMLKELLQDPDEFAFHPFVVAMATPQDPDQLNWQTKDSAIAPLFSQTPVYPEPLNSYHTTILTSDSISYYQYIYRHPDSTLSGIILPLDSMFVHTKNEMSWALRNVSSISLLQQHLVDQRWFFAIALGLIAMLVVFNTWLARRLSRGISQPIMALTKGMHKAGKGDLEHRIQVKAKDEIAYLVQSFNTMIAELQSSRIKLQKAERAAAWRDMARQVSHEIKNPLTPMQFSLYRLRTELEHFPALIQTVEMLDQEITTLRKLADAFSQFAQTPPLHLQQIDLVPLLRSIVQLYEQEKEIDIKFESVSSCRAVMDPEQIKRVMHNLIKNAIEASPGKPTIIVCCELVENRQIKLSVQDNGTGMPQEVINKLFKPYFTTKKEGTGLGMFMVQRIIQDHGGELSVYSEKGKGTRIDISLPALYEKG
ncbi:HAMP domain-containing protein [candidate division KSB1 bacterium]|nr:HAMP domain-containing protein [candidate division KSB1 bacterium]